MPEGLSRNVQHSIEQRWLSNHGFPHPELCLLHYQLPLIIYQGEFSSFYDQMRPMTADLERQLEEKLNNIKDIKAFLESQTGANISMLGPIWEEQKELDSSETSSVKRHSQNSMQTLLQSPTNQYQSASSFPLTSQPTPNSPSSTLNVNFLAELPFPLQDQNSTNSSNTRAPNNLPLEPDEDNNIPLNLRFLPPTRNSDHDRSSTSSSQRSLFSSVRHTPNSVQSSSRSLSNLSSRSSVASRLSWSARNEGEAVLYAEGNAEAGNVGLDGEMIGNGQVNENQFQPIVRVTPVDAAASEVTSNSSVTRIGGNGEHGLGPSRIQVPQFPISYNESPTFQDSQARISQQPAQIPSLDRLSLGE